jgi:hypothetical protein
LKVFEYSKFNFFFMLNPLKKGYFFL